MDKVDLAIERQVIDWLQWNEFEERLDKNPDDSHMAKLTLETLAKRKQAYTAALDRVKELEKQIADFSKMLEAGLGRRNTLKDPK